MYEINPVGYCVLDSEMEKCVHISYGVEDAPKDAVLLYDQYSVERLQTRMAALAIDNQYLVSQLTSTKQPEATTQDIEGASEMPPEYKKIVYVKVKGKKKMEVHSYVNSVEEDNATIIANVRKDMKEAKIGVENVFVVEKR